MKKGIVITSILMLVLAVTAMAQAPNSFVYQGRLTTASGDPIVTTTNVTFRLYSALTGGTLLHTWTNVPVTPDNNGVFTAELTTLDRADFAAGDKLYMLLEIGGQTLTPRQLLTSVPYAYSAEYARIIPGIAVTYNNGSKEIPDAFALIDSVTITTPAAGYVKVTLAGFGSVSSDGSGVVGNARAQITSSRPTSITFVDALIGTNSGNIGTGAIWWGNMGAEKVYYHASAGSYKYFLSVDQGADQGSAYIYYYHFGAEYFPTTFGAVQTIINSQDDEFDAANAVEVLLPGSDVPEYYPVNFVNLKELEARANAGNKE